MSQISTPSADSLATAGASDFEVAPPWHVSRWFNAREPLSLEALRGQVVVLHAFQMLCPACVHQGLPQAERIHRHFGSSDGLRVIGLHTVFEHHQAMNEEALAAYIHEFRWSFPIGVDARLGQSRIPQTMASYGMQGTPTLILIDAQGRIRHHGFGAEDDLAVGAAIGELLAEARSLV